MAHQKILILGGGGREHAMCLALATGTPKPTLLIAPGNPGTASLGTNIDIAADNITELVAYACANHVDLVVPGPEQPLVAGISDAMLAAGIPCMGPSSAAARLEASKSFSREFGNTIGMPQPKFVVVRDAEHLPCALEQFDALPVLKADGLAAGKGVYLPDTLEDCHHIGLELFNGALGDAGKTVVVEERLTGVEASLFYACHGTDVVLLPHARDHKRLGDGDLGPNTGGMGAISPNPTLRQEDIDTVTHQIVAPTLKELTRRGTPFVGFLFVGIMLTQKGPQLLEFNVRLGDPEAQVILPRLEDGAFLQLCQAAATGKLAGHQLRSNAMATCAIVLCAHHYPDTPRTGDAIWVDEGLETNARWMIHAGTRLHNNALETAGGRVAAVVSRAKNIDAARAHAYEGMEHIRFEGMQYRQDIGIHHSIEESHVS